MTTKFIPASLYPLIDEAVGGVVFDEDGAPLGNADTLSMGHPDSLTQQANGVDWTWDTDWTPEQEAEWDLVVRQVNRSRRLDTSDDDLIASIVPTLRNYREQAIGGVTDEQTQRAINALIDIVRVLARDDD